MTLKGVSGTIVAQKPQPYADAATMVNKTSEKTVPADVLAQLVNMERCLRSLATSGRPSGLEAPVEFSFPTTSAGGPPRTALDDGVQGDDGGERTSIGQYIKGVDQTPALFTNAVGSPRDAAPVNVLKDEAGGKKKRKDREEKEEGEKKKKESKKDKKEKKEKKEKKKKGGDSD